MAEANLLTEASSVLSESLVQGPSSESIRIFLRSRPVPEPSENVQYEVEEGQLTVRVPKDASTGHVNNSSETYLFNFDALFLPDATQEEVFSEVAARVVESALQGFNGTVFAYGSTGSGKTFTITGGMQRYEDRGLVPRAISHAFHCMAAHPDHAYQVYVSYLEIYNDAGYDLLDPAREIHGFEDLPRVTVFEDASSGVSLRNLSLHVAADEEAALNLLFMGDTNRAISETPMNLASSRSHCIFTLHIEARQAGGNSVRRSKLHLVDLAGSERIKRTGIQGGALLRESKHINLSLHFLEQVIVALQERARPGGRSHIPYRNSMMTTVLRDSLGGNCCTAMVATISPSADQLPESIATCRFAQRVAQISNQVVVNEEEDPFMVIQRLRTQVADLQAELRLARGEDADDDPATLSSDALAQVQGSVEAYLQDPSPLARLELHPPRLVSFRAACARLKSLAGSPPPQQGSSTSPGNYNAISQLLPPAQHGLEAEVERLQAQVRQRDGELAVLMGMAPPRLPPPPPRGSPAVPSQPLPARASSFLEPSSTTVLTEGSRSTAAADADVAVSLASSPVKLGEAASPDSSPSKLAGQEGSRQQQFETFLSSYARAGELQRAKKQLSSLHSRAKHKAAEAAASRERIEAAKKELERVRLQKLLPGLSQGGVLNLQPVSDPREAALQDTLTQEKDRCKVLCEQADGSKLELTLLQGSMTALRSEVQRDFKAYLSGLGSASGP